MAIDGIDFDDDVNKLLLKICREKRTEDNFESCEHCRLKFKCWTHK